MIFRKKSSQLLETMRIDPKDFSDSLLAQHGKDAQFFDYLIFHFSDFVVTELTNAHFIRFIKDLCLSDRSPIYNQLFDIFNYIRLYRDGGVFQLFKYRQAEWGGPKIRIVESDIPSWDSKELTEPIVVYRGMSKAEYNSGQFGQSWTLQQQVAQCFATTTYTDQEPGIVVKTYLRIESVLHFDPEDCEGEIIVKDGSIQKVEIVQI